MSASSFNDEQIEAVLRGASGGYCNLTPEDVRNLATQVLQARAERDAAIRQLNKQVGAAAARENRLRDERDAAWADHDELAQSLCTVTAERDEALERVAQVEEDFEDFPKIVQLYFDESKQLRAERDEALARAAQWERAYTAEGAENDKLLQRLKERVRELEQRETQVARHAYESGLNRDGPFFEDMEKRIAQLEAENAELRKERNIMTGIALAVDHARLEKAERLLQVVERLTHADGTHLGSGGDEGCPECRLLWRLRAAMEGEGDE